MVDRIKAVPLRADGYGYEEIAQVLFLSDEAICKHIDDFIHENKLKPANGGSELRLDDQQRVNFWSIRTNGFTSVSGRSRIRTMLLQTSDPTSSRRSVAPHLLFFRLAKIVKYAKVSTS